MKIDQPSKVRNNNNNNSNVLLRSCSFSPVVLMILFRVANVWFIEWSKWLI